MDVAIRDAREADADAIATIYGHHVLHGTASYEIDPPSSADMRIKISHIGKMGWPFIVAENGGDLLGYAYATQFRDRAAYRFTCEDSIYVAAAHTGCGIGKALLGRLIEQSADFGFKTMIAVVGGAEPASIALHEALGFAHAGRLTAVGFKFERWLDSVYLQLKLPQSGPTLPQP